MKHTTRKKSYCAIGGGVSCRLRKSISTFLLLFILFSSNLIGQTITSTAGGGNWNTGSTWVGGIVPGAGSDVVIANSATVTIDVNTAAINSLSVGQGTSGI